MTADPVNSLTLLMAWIEGLGPVDSEDKVAVFFYFTSLLWSITQ